jgi:sporulation protein YlmC with PRC-barrel domain
MKSFRKEDIIGKPVIETSGTVKGKVKDITFDLAGTITLIIDGVDGNDFQVPISKVTGISDDVVVRSDLATGASSAQGQNCKYCGKPISPGQTWCPSCGKAQA